MYQTSPEEPALVVGKLAHRHSSAAVLLGNYSVQGNTVSTILYVECIRVHFTSDPCGIPWDSR